MDEACKYFAAQVANEKLVAMTGFQDSKVYKHFSTQLSCDRRMDEKKEFNAQLDLPDKQHKFIIQRSLTGYDYKSQMHRSSMLEKLYLINENLCFATRDEAAQQYHEKKPAFTNKRIKACKECGGTFCLESGSAELTCVNCGRIEILDGRHLHRKNHTMLANQPENTRSNIPLIGFSIIVIYYQHNYSLTK